MMPVARVSSHASAFMKATMSTSPLSQSCATAGTRPSSFEKSNSIMRGNPLDGSYSDTSMLRRLQVTSAPKMRS